MLEEGHAKIDSNAVIAEHCLVLETGEEEIWAEEKRHDEEELARLARRTPEEVARDRTEKEIIHKHVVRLCKRSDAALLVQAGAAAIARGELVWSAEGCLLPADDLALGQSSPQNFPK